MPRGTHRLPRGPPDPTWPRAGAIYNSPRCPRRKMGCQRQTRRAGRVESCLPGDPKDGLLGPRDGGRLERRGRGFQHFQGVSPLVFFVVFPVIVVLWTEIVFVRGWFIIPPRGILFRYVRFFVFTCTAEINGYSDVPAYPYSMYTYCIGVAQQYVSYVVERV